MFKDTNFLPEYSAAEILKVEGGMYRWTRQASKPHALRGVP